MSDSKELKRLATLKRGDDEPRVSLDEFTDDKGNAHRYLSLRIWYLGDDGNVKPTKRGLTIRKHEVLDVGRALRAGLDALDAPPVPPARAEPKQRSLDPFDLDGEDSNGLF